MKCFNEMILILTVTLTLLIGCSKDKDNIVNPFPTSPIDGTWTRYCGIAGDVKIVFKKGKHYDIYYGDDTTVSITGTYYLYQDNNQFSMADDKDASNCSAFGYYRFKLADSSFILKTIVEECNGRDYVMEGSWRRQ